jgi:hypothetical protein
MFQNIPAEKILDVVKQGPTIPVRVAKVVGGDTMIVGAILSTLISTGDVRVSSLKIGGSPLYYVPAHEARLEEFINYLNDKDQKTFKLLKDQKVLKDSEQDPLIRVSLRTIKDFAKPMEIEMHGQKELFWRYYQEPKDEAIALAKSLVRIPEPVKAILAEPIRPAEDISAVQPAVNVSKPRVIAKEISASKIDFLEIVKKHLAEKDLDIISKEKIKKTEYDFVLKNHDTNEYIYCKAKDKKTINEGDLASAFVFAQNKKMPCIFLATGNLTKKAEAMTCKEFSGMKVEKI